jgi:hypothetical protein
VRLYFSKATNGNGKADLLKFVSDNCMTASARPQLVINYAIP